MSFILNPDSQLPYQHAVELSTVHETCPGGLLREDNPTATLCSLKSIIRPAPSPFPSTNLKRVMGDMGNAVWSYTLHGADGDHVIASCSDAGPGQKRGGLCIGVALYHDLMLTVHVREVDIPRLPILIATTQTMLTKWEADARSE